MFRKCHMQRVIQVDILLIFWKCCTRWVVQVAIFLIFWKCHTEWVIQVNIFAFRKIFHSIFGHVMQLNQSGSSIDTGQIIYCYRPVLGNAIYHCHGIGFSTINIFPVPKVNIILPMTYIGIACENSSIQCHWLEINSLCFMPLWVMFGRWYNQLWSNLFRRCIKCGQVRSLNNKVYPSLPFTVIRGCPLWRWFMSMSHSHTGMCRQCSSSSYWGIWVTCT